MRSGALPLGDSVCPSYFILENTMNSLSSPMQCPKWTACNAPVCPLDPNYRLCQTRNGEASCLWLREAVKASEGSALPPEIAPKILEALPVLLAAGGAALRRSLARASRSRSKRSSVALGGHVATAQAGPFGGSHRPRCLVPQRRVPMEVSA